LARKEKSICEYVRSWVRWERIRGSREKSVSGKRNIARSREIVVQIAPR
jgi:hypothetical protein